MPESSTYPILETTILEYFQQLPETLQQEVLHYTICLRLMQKTHCHHNQNDKQVSSKALLLYCYLKTLMNH